LAGRLVSISLQNPSIVDRKMAYRRANLYEELPNRIPIVHGVECSDLVDTHWRYFQDPGNLIHDADTCVAMLSLAEIEKRHNGRFFVLRRIAFKDLIDEGEVLCGELEGDGRVVFRGISVL
jgi:hypothetical protein